VPIIKSAQKREVQNEKRRARLKPFKTRMLTMIKNIVNWCKDGEVAKAESFLAETYSAIDTAAKKNIIEKNNASRKKSLVQRTVSKAKVANPEGEATPAIKKTPAKKAVAKAPAKKAPAKKVVAKKAPAKKA